MRGQGRIFRPKNGRGQYSAVYHYQFGHRGKQYTGSTGTKSKKDAWEILRQKIGEVRGGTIIISPDEVTIHDLRSLQETSYDLNQLRSKDRVEQYWNHLERFFGAESLAIDVNALRLDDYKGKRLRQEASPQTINNELSALRRGFTLAIEKGVLAVSPRFKLQKVHNARTGFLTEGEFGALMLELPSEVRELVQFLRATGWRRDEGRLLQWSLVDLDAGTIRLEEARSKSGKPRLFPFSLAPSLKALIEERYKQRDGTFVFHRHGQPLGIGLIRSSWKRATRRAGLAGKLLHDLRRDAARAFIGAGIAQHIVMRLCGWETDSVFRRYAIVSEQDLASAVALRFANSKTTGSPEPSKQN